MKIKSRYTLRTALVASLFVFAHPASAQTIINSFADTRVDDRDDNNLGDTLVNGNNNTGFFTVAGIGNTHSVFAFQMTGIADASQITDADFSLTNTRVEAGFNIDMHVVRVSSASAFAVSDYEDSAQLIMEDFSTSTIGTGTHSLDTISSATFTTYLQNNWSDGDYLFIGLKTDPFTLDTGGNNYYEYTVDSGVLTVTIPEPSTAGLMLGLSALGLLAMRRRK